MTQKNKNPLGVEVKKLFRPDLITSSLVSAFNADLDQIASQLDESQLEAFAYFKNAQTKGFLKKFLHPNLDKSLHEKCLEKFIEINNHMGNFNDLAQCKSAYGDKSLDIILERARNIVHNVLYSERNFRDEWFLNCKHGPGVTIGTKFSDTSLESKFTLPLSITTSCKQVFSEYLRYNKSLYVLLAGRMPAIGADFSTEYIEFLIKPGSRASTVDKDNTKRRFIAIEPTCNMFLQQGLMMMMYDRLGAAGLCLAELPDKHKRLALESSVSGKNATIDFSSASDTVSIGLLRYLFPRVWYDALMQVRSPSVEINERHIDLNMYATMGNATTFPVETLIFYSLAAACVSYVDPKMNPNSKLTSFSHRNKVSVFGDDCILPVEAAHLFCKTCEALGFSVNADKTFIEGPFRESCGGDYYRGFDVRPFYLKNPVSEKRSSLGPWIHIIVNRLLLTYKKWVKDESFLMNSKLAEWAKQILVEHELGFFLVPPFYPDDAGFKINDDADRCFYLYICPENSMFHISGVHYQALKELPSAHQFGLIKFKYKRFTYRRTRKTNQSLRYIFELIRLEKRQLQDTQMSMNSYFWLHSMFDALETPLYQKTKTLGGYVDAYGYSAHWLS